MQTFIKTRYRPYLEV